MENEEYKKIEIELIDNKGNHWGHIKDDGEIALIAMYEDGKLERKFNLDRKQLCQLSNVLEMIKYR